MSKEIISRLRVKPTQARSSIIKAIIAKRVPMLHGSPAIGKSSIVRSIADQFKLKLLDERLSLKEPTDLQGFPTINTVTNKADYVPMVGFPVKGDELPWIDENDHSKGKYEGWLLFLDELTSAKPEVQAPAYKLILDRMVGNHELHEKVAMVGAGNLEGDNAIVYPMSTALQSRMVHLELMLDVNEWISWAFNKGIDHRITDFIQFRPDALYTFSPEHNDLTYASPRTWEFANDLLNACNKNVEDHDFLALASGSVSEGVAREFITFCEIYTQLPKIGDILMSPRTIPVPGEPSILFALTGSLATQANDRTMDKLMEYVIRLPVEFQVVTLRSIIARDKSLLQQPGIRKWISEHGAALV